MASKQFTCEAKVSCVTRSTKANLSCQAGDSRGDVDAASYGRPLGIEPETQKMTVHLIAY